MTRLTLKQAENLWAASNYDLHAAVAAVQGAQGDAVAASKRPNPILSVNSATINPSRGVGGGGVWDKQVDTIFRIDQVIERGDKRALRTRAAGLGLAAAQRDQVDTGRQQRFVLETAYFGLSAAQERERIAQQNVELYRKTLAGMELRLKAGDIAAVDVSLVTVDVLRAEKEARTASAERSRMQVALGYLIGAAESASRIHAVDALPTGPQVNQRNQPVTSDILARRPDTQAARLRTEQAEKNRELARAQRKADITVGVQYEHYPPDGRNLYGLGFSVPLQVNDSYEGQLRRAEADLDLARNNQLRVEASAIAEIHRASGDLDAAQDTLTHTRDITEKAEKSATATEFAFLHGAASVLELLDAKRTLYSARLEELNARLDYATALSAWRAATLSGDL